MLSPSFIDLQFQRGKPDMFQGDARTEILEDAGALDLLSQLQPRRIPGEPDPDETPPAQPAGQPGWPASGWPQAAQAWPPQPNLGEPGPSDWARPSAPSASSAQGSGKNNPFKKPGPSGADWATLPVEARVADAPYPAPTSGFPDAGAFPAFPGPAQPAAPRPTSASNPFRKDKDGWPAVSGSDLDAFQSVRPMAKEPAARPPFQEDSGRWQADAPVPLAPQEPASKLLKLKGVIYGIIY